MKAPTLFLAVGSLGAAIAGWSHGGVTGGAALGLALGLAWLSLWSARERSRRQAPWIVAAGLAGGALGLSALVTGGVGFGFALALLGAGVFLSGTQLSLFFEGLPEGVELPEPLSLTTNLAAGADESLRFVWSATGLVSPPPSPGGLVADLQAAVRRHEEDGILEDPRRAHPLPPALEKTGLARLQVRGLGEVEHLEFESEYSARDPEVRDEFDAIAPNRTSHAYLWRHGDRPRPTLICVHGYGMGRIGLDARSWDIENWHHRLGLDLVMPVLPLHGPRSVGRRSGEGFLDGHPLQTNAAFGQAIWELRRLTGWLRNQGAPAVGVHGLSLGGYTTALFASIESGLACAIPSIPLVALYELLSQDLSPSAREERERAGLTADLLKEAWAPHQPLRHAPQLAKPARLIVAARADRICPPHQAHALWEHWERPHMEWTPGSHLVPVGRSETRTRIATHLEETLLSAATPTLSRFRVRDPEASALS